MVRNKKFLSLYEKSKILEEFSNGMSVTALSKKYKVAKSTICAIKNKKNKILKIVNELQRPEKLKKCTLKKSENPEMEKLLYKWFLKQRERNLPITSDMLKQKALELHKKLTIGSKSFNASDGWLQKFKWRYGARILKISGEKLSSQPDLVEPFTNELKETIKELDLSDHQIYNADETGLYWKLLPDKTYVALHEKTAPGLKISKQRVTFLGCVNASGFHKLNPLLIGKAKSPRCFKNFDNPIVYKNTKNAWMTQEIFRNWFFKQFVPEVTSYLRSENLPVKAVLLLDNAPSHPPAEELKSSNGNIFVIYMPPLIQPMDQNVLRLTKLFYRKSVLSSMITKRGTVADALKSLTLKDAVIHLHLAWQQLNPSVIQKCWHNILGRTRDEDDIPLSRLQEIWNNEVTNNAINDTIKLLETIEPVEYSAQDVEEWNEDAIQENIDFDINENADSESECENLGIVENIISHSEVLDALNTVSKWANQNYVGISEIVSLKKLEEKALALKLSQRKKQTKITSIFK